MTPIAGSRWEFTFTLIDTFTDTITIDTDVETMSDGTVVISCSTQFGSAGTVTFTEFPVSIGGGLGFSLTIPSGDVTEFYLFRVNGGEANGYYSLLLDEHFGDPYDMTGVCISGCNKDCAGFSNGTAYVDNCGNCVGGTTGLSECPQDCAGVWGGSAYTDSCGVCVGDDTGNDPCATDEGGGAEAVLSVVLSNKTTLSGGGIRQVLSFRREKKQLRPIVSERPGPKVQTIFQIVWRENDRTVCRVFRRHCQDRGTI